MRESSGATSSTGPTLWDSVARLVAEEGLVLFDLQVPMARSGALRVFISRPRGSSLEALPVRESEHGDEIAESSKVGVSLEDCARVSRRISEFFESGEFERSTNLGFDWATEDWTIEVSSPGVNRALTRDEHFHGAVGERVRLRITRAQADRMPQITSTTIFGEIVRVDQDALTLKEERSGGEISVPKEAIVEARVDFVFGGAPKRKFSPAKGKGRKK